MGNAKELTFKVAPIWLFPIIRPYSVISTYLPEYVFSKLDIRANFQQSSLWQLERKLSKSNVKRQK